VKNPKIFKELFSYCEDFEVKDIGRYTFFQNLGLE